MEQIFKEDNMKWENEFTFSAYFNLSDDQKKEYEREAKDILADFPSIKAAAPGLADYISRDYEGKWDCNGEKVYEDWCFEAFNRVNWAQIATAILREVITAKKSKAAKKA